MLPTLMRTPCLRADDDYDTAVRQDRAPSSTSSVLRTRGQRHLGFQLMVVWDPLLSGMKAVAVAAGKIHVS